MASGFVLGRYPSGMDNLHDCDELNYPFYAMIRSLHCFFCPMVKSNLLF